MYKLNIGSGYVKGTPIFKDWVNVDFRCEPDKDEWKERTYLDFDLVGNWPLPDEKADCIFASHIFEHFHYKEILLVVKQCYRVLKTGRPIRIICPDPRIFIKNWQLKNEAFIYACYGKDNFDRWNYGQCPNISYTDMFFHDHYDHNLCPSIDFLMVAMIRVGFSKVYEMNYGCSMFPEYFGSGSFDAKDTSIDNRPVMSYYLEGVK